MQITKRRAIITLVAIGVVIAGVYASAALGGADSDPNAPPVSEAPYKVIALGDTYYPSAYGIKSDGVLRIEVNVEPSGVVELDANMEPLGRTTKILEIPSGSWELYDRTTRDQIGK